MTVKCRIGVDDHDSYEELVAFVGHVARKGNVTHFIVHARKALLNGLSPEQNRRIPPLKYEVVRQLARDFPDIRFTLNGARAAQPESPGSSSISPVPTQGSRAEHAHLPRLDPTHSRDASRPQAASSRSQPARTSSGKGLQRRIGSAPPPAPEQPQLAGGSCTGRWWAGRCGTSRGTSWRTRTGGCGVLRTPRPAGGRRAPPLPWFFVHTSIRNQTKVCPHRVSCRLLTAHCRGRSASQVLTEYAEYADEALRCQRFGPGHPTVRAVRARPPFSRRPTGSYILLFSDAVVPSP